MPPVHPPPRSCLLHPPASLAQDTGDDPGRVRIEKAIALEEALLADSEPLVRALIDFSAEASLCFPELLFRSDVNRFEIQPKSRWAEASAAEPSDAAANGKANGLADGQADGQADDGHTGAECSSPPLQRRSTITSCARALGRLGQSGLGNQKSGRLRFNSGRGSQRQDRRRDEERRRQELHRTNRRRNEQHPQDTRWVEVLENLVEGYRWHVAVRCGGHRELLPPSWTDLFLWSVMTGRSDAMVHTLWRQTRFPLRSAVMASQLCAALAERSTDELLEEELLECARRYETWAVSLLQVSSRAQAMGMLSLVPHRAGHLLYQASVLDMAASELGGIPLKRVVSHHHAQELIESFFVGDCKPSHACWRAARPNPRHSRPPRHAPTLLSCAAHAHEPSRLSPLFPRLLPNPLLSLWTLLGRRSGQPRADRLERLLFGHPPAALLALPPGRLLRADALSFRGEGRQQQKQELGAQGGAQGGAQARAQGEGARRAKMDVSGSGSVVSVVGVLVGGAGGPHARGTPRGGAASQRDGRGASSGRVSPE